MSRSEVKPGSLVELIRLNRWGGQASTGRLGVALKRVYLTYEVDRNRWEVYVDGEIKIVERREIRTRV